MISIYDIKKSKIRKGDKPLLMVELRGLSTDEKPLVIDNGEIENGSQFIEIDSGDIYLYNGDSEEWSKI